MGKLNNIAITVFQVLTESGIKFSQADIQILGVWVKNAYLARYKELPPKVDSVEDGEVFRVFSYPPEFEYVIRAKASYYFSRKGKPIPKPLYKEQNVNIQKVSEPKKVFSKKIVKKRKEKRPRILKTK